MKTYVYLWKYLAEFLEREMFQTRVLKKESKHVIMFNYIFFPRKSCRFLDNVKKCVTARQVTDDNTIWRRRFSCRINKPKI
jgi:hypothetical protein